MTFFIPTSCFAQKIARTIPKFEKKFNIPVTYWSYGLDVIFFCGPFPATRLNFQHASLPDVPVMYCNSRRRQKTIIHIKKDLSLRKNYGMSWVGRDLKDPLLPIPLPWVGTTSTRLGKEYGFFALETCKFLNGKWELVTSTLLSPPPKKKKKAVFHSRQTIPNPFYLTRYSQAMFVMK